MRLIDADELIKQIEADAEHIETPLAKMLLYANISDIKHAPTIAQPKSYREGYQAGFKDAQSERKKGKWIYNSPVTMKCNQCGLTIKDWNWHRFKYCPNCGADMREASND